MRHIFLIGLSGSGKSTVGRLLERYLGIPLLDIDTLIEEECGERIPAIFARHGEEYFRLLRYAHSPLDPILSPHYITCFSRVLTGIRRPSWFALLWTRTRSRLQGR